jgi:hypothetical protein
MSHGITDRDIQVSANQAWHGLTTIHEGKITREIAHPFEIIESPIYHKVSKPNDYGINEDTFIECPTFKQLLASDDFLPIGEPYASSYCPSSIETFWEIVRKGFGDTPYEVVSAGTVDNRCKVFASIKVSDGFRIGDREFKDFITILDSYDKSTSLQARYSNVCVVCANTFAANMQSGTQVGKAKHTQMIEMNISRLIDAIDGFIGTSASFKALLTEAYTTPCSRDEARAWITGIEGRNATASGLTNGMLQKTARMVELFDQGRGNEGRTRLDAFSAVTDFHSNESSNRKSEGAQRYSSEFGASAQVKNLVATRFEKDWEHNVRVGEGLLARDKAVLVS